MYEGYTVVKQRRPMYTLFRYQVVCNTFLPKQWVDGSYESRKPLKLSTVSRRLRSSWKRNAPWAKITTIELINAS